MITFIAFIFACVSVVYVLADSPLPIVSHVREFLSEDFYLFARLFTCPFCLGFWAGFGMSFVFDIQINTLVPVLDHVLLGLVASGSCGILYRD